MPEPIGQTVQQMVKDFWENAPLSVEELEAVAAAYGKRSRAVGLTKEIGAVNAKILGDWFMGMSDDSVIATGEPVEGGSPDCQLLKIKLEGPSLVLPIDLGDEGAAEFCLQLLTECVELMPDLNNEQHATVFYSLALGLDPSMGNPSS